jgi:hypothetical protein
MGLVMAEYRERDAYLTRNAGRLAQELYVILGDQEGRGGALTASLLEVQQRQQRRRVQLPAPRQPQLQAQGQGTQIERHAAPPPEQPEAIRPPVHTESPLKPPAPNSGTVSFF